MYRYNIIFMYNLKIASEYNYNYMIHGFYSFWLFASQLGMYIFYICS